MSIIVDHFISSYIPLDDKNSLHCFGVIDLFSLPFRISISGQRLFPLSGIVLSLRGNTIGVSKYIQDSGGEEPEQVLNKAVAHSDHEDNNMKIDDEAGPPPSSSTSEESVVIINSSPAAPAAVKLLSKPSVMLLSYHEVPGIDLDRSYLKAQKTLAKAEKTSKASPHFKKAKHSQDADLSANSELLIVRANLQTVQTRVGNLDFEISSLSRCLADFHEQEATLRIGLHKLEKIERSRK
ncbi:hypothetical protein CPB84DRAFT_1849702 [Gymnopilus junonius]|uniref:Uncharacterized protein n=1 Tax=Gymnopilus junonius TaxID=109634 RepID=A0A9P5TL58_GYMJU|nr:hypothetical protein CPB84DRAFT_1849702 [Gymnopilus junonius]